MTTLLQDKEKCDTLQQDYQQIIKFMRRLQALPDGRHEIIVTVDGGLQDWTVRPIGKVER